MDPAMAPEGVRGRGVPLRVAAADHAACRRLLETAPEPRVLPAPVLVEVAYWTHRRLGPGAVLGLPVHMLAWTLPDVDDDT